MTTDHNDNLLESLLAITAEESAAYQASQAARDQELADAFEELAEMPPESYQDMQYRVYRRHIKNGNHRSALSALWRAAGSLNLLTQSEKTDPQWDLALSPARVSELIARLGWE